MDNTRQRRARCPFEFELMPYATKCMIHAMCGLGRNFDVDLYVRITLMWRANEWICIRHHCKCSRRRRCMNVIGEDAVHEEGSGMV